MKKLDEMTLEELWQLFPIILAEHNPNWRIWYNEEIVNLKGILHKGIEYYHIGSTAIKEIWAKPIIDILIVVNVKSEIAQIAKRLQDNDYIIMSQSSNRISLNKGYTQNGFSEKVFHLHIRLKDDIDELYFCKYLNEHFEVAKEYEKLKLQLWKEFEHNRDGYTTAKTEFIKKYTLLAKEFYCTFN